MTAWAVTMARASNASFPRLSSHATVLDLGCGNDVPASRMLPERFNVTGVDISEAQISRARHLVPTGTFLRADIASIEFPPASFDAVVSFFALIHVPVQEQRLVLGRIRTLAGARWLIPCGGRASFVESVGKAEFGEPRFEAEPRRSQDVEHVVRRGRATATGAVHRDPRAGPPIDGNGDGADGMLAIAIKGANASESILPRRIDPELA